MKRLLFVMCACAWACLTQAQRSEQLLEKNWRFVQADPQGAEQNNFNDAAWQQVRIPHDWAITGPFSRDYDLQNVAVTQNGEKTASVKTGRTGGLPYVGVGWYRMHFDVDSYNARKQSVTLVFDGAMSEANVYVNGQKAIFWPYGYNSFYCDVTSLINADGKDNVLAVRLENRPQSSRWYPGAGLYRNVHLQVTDKTHIPVWGTQVTTSHVEADYATVNLKTEITGADEADLWIETQIFSSSGEMVASKKTSGSTKNKQLKTQNFVIDNPQLWTPETPYLYEAKTTLYKEGTVVDKYNTRFGIRSIEVVPEKGFYLNGKRRQFKGVCNHHDLGPLGAAINVSALRHQLQMLKDMGCDAVRTSHNMPAPELVALCDEMGFMMMLEPFDEWDVAKCKNGYHRYFKEWAEKDMVNMIRQYRNNPSVVMWSIGNEVPSQWKKEGVEVAKFLQDICHREDPTRPVTCGMDQVSAVLDNGFAAQLDVPGFNYRVHRYEEGYSRLPQGVLLGSETCSTVSSRGSYKFPVEIKADAVYPDHQSSSYDTEYCSWSNIPDYDFAMADDHEWSMGQFVWTGFDYLGEPSPYDTDAWPNHSSMFGMIDLASIPKDRFYLYRSLWNTREHTLHVLPHWTWKGREGEVTPVYVYTDYPEVELFVNGVSQGRKQKNAAVLEDRYRLRWNDVVYQPGSIRVVAYDKAGQVAEEKVVKTAGEPHHLLLTTDRTKLNADGKDLAYVTVDVVDKDGQLCPLAANDLKFKVTGRMQFKAVANGDPTSLQSFQQPTMKAFNGRLTVIVEASEIAGEGLLQVTGKGLKAGTMVLKVQ